MEALSNERSRRLAKLLFRLLSTTEFRCPSSEGEVAYTSRVLCPAVSNELKELGLGVRLRLKGDGTGERALPASFLDQSFYPDLAISRGRQNLWAAEVKILRRTSRQNAIATAFGQASLYMSRYEHVTIVFIDTVPGYINADQIGELRTDVKVPVIVRKAAGTKLSPFNAASL